MLSDDFHIALDQLSDMDDMVKHIANDVKRTFPALHTITSLVRLNDKGVHGVGRGIDIRCHDDNLGKSAEAYVNAKYSYDHKRPGLNCALYHDAGTGNHLHLQSHPNTRVK